jgi:Zn-dependent protease with chaperone function
MDPDELLFILGHELAHIKCGHCKYLVLTNATVDTIVNQGIAALADVAFKFWSRKAEFTCDRGGVLACRNPQAAMKALAKLEIQDPFEAEEFIHKCVRGNPSDDDLLATHPDTGNRIAAVFHYVRTRECASLGALWRD